MLHKFKYSAVHSQSRITSLLGVNVVASLPATATNIFYFIILEQISLLLILKYAINTNQVLFAMFWLIKSLLDWKEMLSKSYFL